MPKTLTKAREEARRLYLTGEASTNSEIANRLRVKAHTIGRWRKEEDWDDLRRKVERKAAEMFAEKIASDRVTLNLRHYRMWELLVAKLADELKVKQTMPIRDLDRIAGILDRAQKGQRLAKGLSITGETEEAIRAQSEAETRHLIDVFVEVVKENVTDETIRERVRAAILNALPEAADAGAGDPDDAFAH